ncbi:MAG: magnesium transporter [Magnetococcales bacterium]|nr:magnesium transporter [Magnetococcales bacterium]NGZ28744.1 magnesium transporter [Magnetococcales bacterium]
MGMIAVDEPQQTAETNQVPRFVETIHRLYHKGATAQLSRVISKLLPADVAMVINSAEDEDEAMALFDLVTNPVQAAGTLKELNEDFQIHIVSLLTLERAVPILENLPPDTRSQLIGNLSPEVGDVLMNALNQETQKEVQDLLQYLPDTAGSLMTTRFFAVPETMTASAALQALRSLPYYEFVFYVYVLDEEERLVGVSSLRQVLLSNANKPVRDIMDPGVLTINVDTHQEEAAKLVTEHGLLALPVVNDQGVLRGIITVDDLIHVIQEADTQAMMKAVGVDADHKMSILAESFVSVAKTRIPWLVAPFLGGLMAAYILSYYEGTMAKVIQLSFFMPMIFGMAGNVGSQTAVVAVRGLATGVIKVSDYYKLLFKETQVGLLIGAFYGVCLSTYALVVFKSTILAFVVGISILSNITYAGVIASSLPLLLQRMGHDPAVGGGPYVLTTVDVLGVINYLVIATMVYGL